MMAFSHFKRLSGILGLWVGKAGAEVQVADASGNLSHGGTALLAATDLNRGALKKVTGALTANDGAGKVFSWANPEDSDILIEHIALKITTKASAACTVDVGTTASTATTLSDNLIDGKDLSAATGTFTNAESGGTNGKLAQRLAAGKWVTASKASGATAGIVGTYEIYYRVL